MSDPSAVLAKGFAEWLGGHSQFRDKYLNQNRHFQTNAQSTSIVNETLSNLCNKAYDSGVGATHAIEALIQLPQDTRSRLPNATFW